MSIKDRALAPLLNAYLHRLPDFRGKWRLLQPLSRLIAGVPIRSRYGDVKLALDVADRTYRLGVTGGYGSTVADAVATLQPGECFVDLGANCGLFSLLASERVEADGLVVALEPCRQTFGKLVRNLALNRADNVLPLMMAVSSQSGQSLLAAGPVGHSGKAAIAERTGQGTDTEMVATLSVRDFPGLLDIIGNRPVLVKIDVEGFELAALHGIEALLEYGGTRGVVIEIDERNLARFGATAQQVYDLLDRHGFERADSVSGEVHFDAVFARPAQHHRLRSAAPRRVAVPPRASSRRRRPHLARAAAVLLLVCGGWIAHEQANFVSSPVGAEEYFIEDAVQSYNVALLRARLYQNKTVRLDARKLGAAMRIDLPILPRGWRIVDVQLFPSDSGPSLQMTISNGIDAPISLYVVRDDEVAPARPAVVERGAAAVAFWQEGELAYALAGDKPPAEIDRMAEELAQTVS